MNGGCSPPSDLQVRNNIQQDRPILALRGQSTLLLQKPGFLSRPFTEGRTCVHSKARSMTRSGLTEMGGAARVVEGGKHGARGLLVCKTGLSQTRREIKENIFTDRQVRD